MNGIAHSMTPNDIEWMSCDVCLAEMNVTRNVNCASGFAEAMVGKKHLHDVFECRFREKKWHKQAYELQNEIRECPSNRIVDIMREELTEILTTRMSTKYKAS